MRLQSDAALPTLERLLREKYGLRLERTEKSSAGAGSDTWFLSCAEGKFVLKFPASSEINHPESELCAFLRENGIPACDFVKNRAGRCVSVDSSGRVFTLQRHLSGRTLEWNSAPETILLESAELLGRIHSVLRNYPALPEGIGAGFFAHMTPQRALASYQGSLATAIRQGDSEIADELEWRIGLMERFPAWKFDLNRLTRCNTHGDYFISQFLCKDGHLTAVIDWTTACVHPVIWEIMRSFVYGAPCCANGEIDTQLLKRYIAAYRRYGTLNAYDRENIDISFCQSITSRAVISESLRFLKNGRAFFRSQYRIGCDSKPANHSLAKTRTNKMALVSAIILLSNGK